MKKRAIYIFAACVALVLSACSKDDAALDYAAGEGGIVMRLAETRAVDISGLTLDDCTVFIYQNETWGRLYIPFGIITGSFGLP